MNDKLIMKEIIEQRKINGARRKPRYGTRKLNIGLVSCMLGLSLVIAPGVASAAESLDASDFTGEGPIDKVEEDIAIEGEDLDQGLKGSADSKKEDVEAFADDKVDAEGQDNAAKTDEGKYQEDVKYSAEAKDLGAKVKKENIEAGKDRQEDQAKADAEKLEESELKKPKAVGDAKEEKKEDLPEARKAEKAIEIDNKFGDDKTAATIGKDDLKQTIWGRTFEDLGGSSNQYNGKAGDTPDAGFILEKQAKENKQMSSKDKLIGNMPVYFQWKDVDGTVSPIYKFKSNKNGYFAINPGEFTSTGPDGVKKIHKFMGDQLVWNLNSKFEYRLWTDEKWLEENKYNAGSTPNGNFAEWGGFKNAVGNLQTQYYLNKSAMQIANAHVNVQRRDDLDQHAPVNERIIQEAKQEIDPKKATDNKLKGSVFWENYYNKSALEYPNYESENSDYGARDITVLLSIKNKDSGEKITYQTKTNGSGNFEFDISDAPQKLGIEPGKNNIKFFDKALINISVADKDGNKFDKATHVWSNSTLGNTFANGDEGLKFDTTEIFSSNFRSNITGARLYSGSFGKFNGTGFKFALRRMFPDIDKLNFDSEDDKAKAGETAKAQVQGIYPYIDYVVEWYEVPEDENSELQLKSKNNVKSGTDGSIPELDFNVPKDLKKETKYIVRLEDKNGNLISERSFLAMPEEIKEKVEPGYEITRGRVGREVTTNPPSFKDKDKDEKVVDKPDGTKFALDEKHPDGAEINENTGAVTYTPKGEDAGKIVDIPVVVTYKDKSVDKTVAKIDVKEPIADIEKPSEEPEETYLRIYFKNGEGVEGIREDVEYYARKGAILNEKNFPKARLKEGYENLTWSYDRKPILEEGIIITAYANRKGAPKPTDNTPTDDDKKPEDSKGDLLVVYPIETHPIFKNVGDDLTEDEIKNAIVVVGLDKSKYTVTINEGQEIPTTDKTGDYIIDLTITYDNGDNEQVQAVIIVKGGETGGSDDDQTPGNGGSTDPSDKSDTEKTDDKSDEDGKDDTKDGDKTPVVDTEKIETGDLNKVRDKEKAPQAEKVNETLDPIKIPSREKIDKALRTDANGNKIGAKNAKTGVGSVSGLVGVVGAALAGLFATKKKEDEDK